MLAALEFEELKFLGHGNLVVKNTFLDPPAERSDSVEEFLEERKVASCPATRHHSGEQTPRHILPTPRPSDANVVFNEQLLADAVDLAQLQSPEQSPGQNFREIPSSMASGYMSSMPALWEQTSTPVLPGWLQNVGNGFAGALGGGAAWYEAANDHMQPLHPFLASPQQQGGATAASTTWQAPLVAEASRGGYHTTLPSGVVHLNL